MSADDQEILDERRIRKHLDDLATRCPRSPLAEDVEHTFDVEPVVCGPNTRG